MTPKEKAKELIEKFKAIEVSAFYTDEDNDVCIASDKMFDIPAIKCAIIVVEEMLRSQEQKDSVIPNIQLWWWKLVYDELKSLQ